MPAKRYVVRKSITGLLIGGAYTTQPNAEKAAQRLNTNSPQALEVWWLDDTGLPRVKVADIRRGVVTRTVESPLG